MAVTLAQIMRMALVMLGEDPADMDEYADAFRLYANEGYAELVQQYAKPRETFVLGADARGFVPTEGLGILRVSGVWRTKGEQHETLPFEPAPDGTGVTVPVQQEDVELLCEVERPPLEEDTDEPCLPPSAHGALINYICYRHLLTGNLAKQSRAQAFRSLFYQQAAALRPQGMGSVRRMRGLYDATDVRR